MIKLKNVSKFYYKKGMIASGISKVNLQLDMGEFVAITGESGSGKSTLLNVISGLDTYEEGEMYIDGKETSHFMEKDFAEYRKKYIGNIFQNFNLVNSYTVYQNVELILMINGYNRQDIKKRVNEILERVGLSKHAKAKASKLSGGQKQRVAIARALAKETDIIVADEPTGNLDSESATEIVKLLHEISKDKLVIVVTHNYEQFAPYVTRKIKMHDGKIAEDLKVNRGQDEDAKANTMQLVDGEHEDAHEANNSKASQRASGKISAGGKLKLGIRNTFNVLPKFILLLIVFTFVAVAVTSQYTSYLAQKEQADNLGFNSYFQNLSLDRMVLKKTDKSKFTKEDYEAINNVYNVKTLTEQDILLDSMIYLGDEDFYYDGAARDLNEFKGKLIAGRMPAKPNEVILASYKGDYNFEGENLQKNVNRKYEICIDSYGTRFITVKVVGLAYKEKSDNLSSISDVYMDGELVDTLMQERYHEHSELSVVVNGKKQEVYAGDTMYNLYPSDVVPEGEAYSTNDLGNYYKDGKIVGRNIDVNIKNIYFQKHKEFKVTKTYTDKNFSSIFGKELDFEALSGVIFVNPADYKKIFTCSNYQVSVFVQDPDVINETKAILEEMGYVPLTMKEALVTSVADVTTLIQLPVAIVVVLALFFIAYFVIRLILRSRTSYFSILRMLGMNMKAMRRIMDVELLVVMTIAFGLFMGVALASQHGYINNDYIHDLVKYLEPVHYGILYVILLVMSYFISGKFSRSLFKNSAMSTYREVE